MTPWMLLLAGALGIAAGAVANFCAERWSHTSRKMSPWTPARGDGARRSRWGHVPILGWWARREELNAVARGCWIRPLLVELGTAALFIGLIWSPTHPGFLASLALWGDEMAQRGPWPAGTWFRPADNMWLLAQFVSHALLFTLMLIASLIDFDEKLIPDEVTAPGTYLGLLLAVAWPSSLPVGLAAQPAGAMQTTIITITTPLGWPRWLEGAPRGTSLAFALVCFAVWYLALWPWFLRRDRSITRGLALTCAWLKRRGRPWIVCWAPAVAVAVIGFTWYHGGERWVALVSSLFGMVFGGAFVWCMRFVASHVMDEEALGFGDVTLMAMIGSFLGWQACLMAFFLSALLALVVALLRFVVLRDRAIYLGPFICAAAAWIVLRWPAWWDLYGPLFGILWLVPSALVLCLGLLWFLLLVVRAIKEFVLRRP